MSRDTLLAALGSGGRLVVDTSVVLSYLNGSDVCSSAAAVVLDDLVGPGSHWATVSAITVTETLVHPFRNGPAAVRIAETFLNHFPNLDIRDVDQVVARAGAELRATIHLRTPDALIVATAIVDGIPTIVTCDDQWRAALVGVTGIRLVHLTDHLPV
jgi:predicted nucleic acid-binding protein